MTKAHQHKVGDGLYVESYCRFGDVIKIGKEGSPYEGKYLMKLDLSRYQDSDAQREEVWCYYGDLSIIVPISIDQVAQTTGPGEKPSYSLGDIIEADGTTHALYRDHTHGVILAILFPDLAKEKGYRPPTEDYDVSLYQRFEIDNGSSMPVVRIAHSKLMETCNISKGNFVCTEAQIQAVRACLNERNIKPHDLVHTDAGELTVKKALIWLTKEDRYERP